MTPIERKTKKVWVEIYEDREDDFFLSLNLTKNNILPNPTESFDILRDSIHVDEMTYWECLDNFGDINMVQAPKSMENFWNYFTAGGEDNRVVATSEINIKFGYEFFD